MQLRPTQDPLGRRLKPDLTAPPSLRAFQSQHTGHPAAAAVPRKPLLLPHLLLDRNLITQAGFCEGWGSPICLVVLWNFSLHFGPSSGLVGPHPCTATAAHPFIPVLSDPLRLSLSQEEKKRPGQRTRC
jgi:hypothetical protein